MTISDVLENRRRERGISIAELSRRTGVSYDTLSRALKGQTRIRADQLIEICKELKIDLNEFETVGT